MNGIESSIYFMLAMLFVGMPATVIGGIAWECRRRSGLAEEPVVGAELPADGLPNDTDVGTPS